MSKWKGAGATARKGKERWEKGQSVLLAPSCVRVAPWCQQSRWGACGVERGWKSGACPLPSFLEGGGEVGDQGRRGKGWKPSVESIFRSARLEITRIFIFLLHSDGCAAHDVVSTCSRDLGWNEWQCDSEREVQPCGRRRGLGALSKSDRRTSGGRMRRTSLTIWVLYTIGGAFSYLFFR